MENRIRLAHENSPRQDPNPREPQPIGEVLAELLAHYAHRFPQARIRVVQTPASVA